MMLEHKNTSEDYKSNELSPSAEKSLNSDEATAESQHPILSSSDQVLKSKTGLSTTRELQSTITQHFKPISTPLKRNVANVPATVDLLQKKTKVCYVQATASSDHEPRSSGMASALSSKIKDKPKSVTTSTPSEMPSSIQTCEPSNESSDAKTEQASGDTQQDDVIEDVKMTDGEDTQRYDADVSGSREISTSGGLNKSQEDLKEDTLFKSITVNAMTKPGGVNISSEATIAMNTDALAKIRQAQKFNRSIKDKKPYDMRDRLIKKNNVVDIKKSNTKLDQDKNGSHEMGIVSGKTSDEDGDGEELRSKNIQFYRNEIESEPDGDTIENILKNWIGQYERLEEHHGYIQWLFPIPEPGLNRHAQPLLPHEHETMREDGEIQNRLLRSYKLMLNFYGMQCRNIKTGTIKRSSNYLERFRNLSRYSHNNLRITRILKCVAELGLEYLQAPLLDFLVDEVFIQNTLTSCKTSLISYWLPTLRDDSERKRLEKIIAEHTPKPNNYKTSYW